MLTLYKTVKTASVTLVFGSAGSAKLNMIIKTVWNLIAVFLLSFSGVKAFVSLRCEQDSENCTISYVQAEKDNLSFDFSSFNDDYDDSDGSDEYIDNMRKNNVKYIEFVNSTLHVIPSPNELYTRLPNVVSLSASNCSIGNISKSDFDGANNLLKLILSNNKIETIDHMVFWGAHNLLELDLSSNLISSIRETAFYNLRNLVELNLANNRIAEVKSEFFRDLNLLKSISLERNEIVRLNGDLFDNNVLLESVQLCDNKIANVGQAFLLRQQNLKYLNLNNNSIGELNSTIHRAKMINLNANKLQTLKVSNLVDGKKSLFLFISS
jgi:Leucine-rich repeat (LRR) protein